MLKIGNQCNFPPLMSAWRNTENFINSWLDPIYLLEHELSSSSYVQIFGGKVKIWHKIFTLLLLLSHLLSRSPACLYLAWCTINANLARAPSNGIMKKTDKDKNHCTSVFLRNIQAAIGSKALVLSPSARPSTSSSSTDCNVVKMSEKHENILCF